MKNKKLTKTRDCYIPKVSWKEYIDSIRSRYPYVLPKPKPIGVHPKLYLEGKTYRIPGGSIPKKWLRKKKKVSDVRSSLDKSKKRP